MWRLAVCVLCFSFGIAWLNHVTAADKSKPVGIDKRTPWTSSRVQGSPEPPEPFRTEVAFPGVKFDEPLDMASSTWVSRLSAAFIIGGPNGGCHRIDRIQRTSKSRRSWSRSRLQILTSA